MVLFCNERNLLFNVVNLESIIMSIIIRRGYIYGVVKGHRKVMFMAAVPSLDGTKPNTNPKTNSKTNPNPNTMQ